MPLIVDPSQTQDPLSVTNAGNADLVKHSTTQDFTTDVIEASRSTPVIVDFWAPWCGPCKTLGPMLEKAVQRAGGLVRMVKINIDEHPALAQQLRVQSVPTVFAFKNGQPVDGFAGAIPESQIKSFIDRLTQGAASPIDQALEQAQGALDDGDGAGAESIFAQVAAHDPGNVKAIAGMVRAIALQKDFPRAHALIGGLDAKARAQADIGAALSALELAEASENIGDLGALEARLNANANDHEARLELAKGLFATAQPERAIDTLLDLLARDRQWNEQAARKQLIKIFDTLGNDDPRTQDGRRRMSSILFS
ncbi:thioredoxin [Varunaivibrio sulfuroxidans]|uniref:Thioredoxin n=1 Tax=Varunaivibrio sulfuroxidans TaxID=1773489 RepID=A0A4R3JJ14_9PROT|nr:thioredoxin [Varunaivibrio sulfuroxidans]TCS64830.1 thioredoxin [Varunaivibrio sulfuroxidans]WES29869.1 thioredoxin [Varunaivibrio sulfuroxidans]